MDHECRQESVLISIENKLTRIENALIGEGENDGIKTRVAIHDKYFKVLFWVVALATSVIVTTAVAKAFGG